MRATACAVFCVLLACVCPLQAQQDSNGKSSQTSSSQLLLTLALLGIEAYQCIPRKNAQPENVIKDWAQKMH